MKISVNLCGAILLTVGFLAPTIVASDAQSRDFLRDVLLAGGVAAHEHQATAAGVQHEIDSIVSRMKRRPGYRHARKLHRILHREYFLTYDPDADGLDRIVAAGRFNCLSGTLFHALVAQELGYEVHILETPGHLMLRLGFHGRVVDVETTSAEGFDAWRHLTALNNMRPLLADNHAEAPDGLGRRGVEVGSAGQRPVLEGTFQDADGPYGESGAGYVLAELDEALGFAWLNSAWRGLEAGNAETVIQGIRAAASRFPELVAHAQGVRSLLSRTFSMEYEAGRFEDAYRVALLEMDVLPQRTTSRDRVLATAWKRIQKSCQADQPASAWSIMQQASARTGQVAETGLFLLRSLPLIAATAVRTDHRDLARLAASAYSEAEPDSVEAIRLTEWVDARLLAAPQSECPLQRQASEKSSISLLR